MQRIISVEGVGNVVVSKRHNCVQIRLTVHPEKGLQMSIPFRVSYADAERFIFEHRDWIHKTLQAQQQKGTTRIFTPQSHFTCRSTTLSYETTDSQKRILSAKIKDYAVTVIYNPNLVDFKLDTVQNFIKKVLLASMRKEAESILYPRVDEISQRTGLKFRKVSIGTALTRWGTCSSHDEIILSCRLLLLPDYLVDFVLLHELCHISEKNHGPKFHALLEKLSGGKKDQYDRELKGFNGRILPDVE
jgi:hypothetical protein